MNLKRQIRILFMLLKMKLSKNMMYRLSFFGVFFVDGTLFLLQIAMFQAIYSKVSGIGGWDQNEMLFFLGTFSLINALSMTFFFFGLLVLPSKIKTGELDLYLTKPVSPLFHVSFESIDLGSLPLVAASIGLLFYATSRMETLVTAYQIFGYVFFVLLMLLLYYDLMVILRTFTFFLLQTSSIISLEGEMIILCMKIPGTLFRKGFRVLFYLVLPYGIVATVPTQFFIGTLSLGGLFQSLLTVLCFTLFTRWFWKYGLRNYKSASS